jgi:hypothetical protein
VDSGATDHITGELEKLSIRNKYQGGNQIHTTSGTGMDISFIGQTSFPTPSCNILYVPKSKKNLVSVHHLTSDNSVFLELHPTFFLVKDQQTRMILLKGRCIGGLYPIPVAAIKEVCSARRTSINMWHNRFGNPSFRIVEQVISQNNLLCSSDPIKELFVMLLNKLRVINCLIQNLHVYLNFPCNLSIPMSGVLHQNLSVERSIMLSSSMTLVNSPGFISSSSNPRCFRSFKSSKVLLNGSFIKRSLLFNHTGEASIRSLTPSPSLASLTMYRARMLINKMVQ